MRALQYALLFAALGASLELAAQDVVTDTTDPETYYPLHVGNEWQFASFYEGEPSLQRRQIVKDTVVAGVAYVVERTCMANAARDRAWQCRPDLLVRFDSASTDIRSLRADGTEQVVQCALGADFGAEVPCGDGTTRYAGGYDGVAPIRNTALPPAAYKFEDLPADPSPSPLYAGIGPGPTLVSGPFSYSEFLYARVDGRRYGYPALLDPESPTRYYPLAIGNTWEYRSTQQGEVTRSARAIVADSVVGDERYFVQVESTEMGSEIVERTSLVRFDSTTSVVRERQEDGREIGITCPLGSPYVLTLPYCTDPGLGTIAQEPAVSGHSVSPGAGIRVGGRSVPMTAFKTFYVDEGPSVKYGAGVGRLPQTQFPDCPSGCNEEMTYLRLVASDGSAREYGSRAITVDEESRPSLDPLAIQAFPNPVASTLSVEVTLQQARTLTLEAFDVLGRRVWYHELESGAGRQLVEVDAGAWAPGLYVVRATQGQTEVTARVVRQ